VGRRALLIGVCLTCWSCRRAARGVWGRIWISLAALAFGGACSLVGGFDPVGLGLGVAVAVLAWRPGQGGGRVGRLAGRLLVVLALAVAQILLPGGSVMLAWPLLAASLAPPWSWPWAGPATAGSPGC
jgi:hypothetical protein